jgi:hypothetical protein
MPGLGPHCQEWIHWERNLNPKPQIPEQLQSHPAAYLTSKAIPEPAPVPRPSTHPLQLNLLLLPSNQLQPAGEPKTRHERNQLPELPHQQPDPDPQHRLERHLLLLEHSQQNTQTVAEAVLHYCVAGQEYMREVSGAH